MLSVEEQENIYTLCHDRFEKVRKDCYEFEMGCKLDYAGQAKEIMQKGYMTFSTKRDLSST